MRGLKSTRIAILLVALAAGCGDSCACGKGGDGAKLAPSAGTRGWPAVTPGSATENGGGGAGASAAEPNPSWQPAPDSAQTQKLKAAKATLETGKVYEQLANPATLGGLLGDRLGALKADGDVFTSQEAGDNQLLVASRNYVDGSKTPSSKSARVKITDTGRVPNARRVVGNRLTLIGNPAAGSERGTFVRGYPAVSAHQEDQRVSRASAVVGDRYLIQILVRDASDPDEALRLLEALDWSALAPKQAH